VLRVTSGYATAIPLATGDVMIVGGYDDDNQNTSGVWRLRAQ
jgi:hypothetical protein